MKRIFCSRPNAALTRQPLALTLARTRLDSVRHFACQRARLDARPAVHRDPGPDLFHVFDTASSIVFVRWSICFSINSETAREIETERSIHRQLACARYGQSFHLGSLVLPDLPSSHIFSILRSQDQEAEGLIEPRKQLRRVKSLYLS